MSASSVPQGIDKPTLEAKRRDYDAERVNAEQTLLRIQGAIIAVEELLALLDAQPQPVAVGETA